MNKRMLRSALATVIFSAVACGGFVEAATLGVAGTHHAEAGGPPDSGWHASPLDSGWRPAAPVEGSDGAADADAATSTTGMTA